MTRAVDWLETAGTFLCERRDCPQDVGKDCSLCDRPVLSRNTAAVVAMYKRCREWRVLPAKGSLLEQPMVLMELLDTVHNRVLFWQRQHADEERGNLMKAEMKTKL